MQSPSKLHWTLLFLLFLVATVPAQAGDVVVIGHFENGGVTAELDTYAEKGVIVAVVAFKANGRTLTFAFDRNDWPSLERLWGAARKQGGAELASVGSLAETGTTEKCVILAAGGPVVRLTIASPIDGAQVFEVPSWMASDFEAKLRQAAAATTAS